MSLEDQALDIIGGLDGYWETYQTGEFSDGVYDALYDLLMSEMPYGTAKARSGDPDDWIGEFLYRAYQNRIRGVFRLSVCKCLCHREETKVLHIAPCCRFTGHKFLLENGDINGPVLHRLIEQVEENKLKKP